MIVPVIVTSLPSVVSLTSPGTQAADADASRGADEGMNGQTVEITGFSGQFANDFEVDPRTQADVRVLPD